MLVLQISNELKISAQSKNRKHSVFDQVFFVIMLIVNIIHVKYVDLYSHEPV